jgi:hypothetical protein
MDISQNALWEEVSRLTSDGAKPVHFRWGCQFILDNETFEPTKLVNVKVTRQYHTQFTDEIVLTVIMPQGQFNHRLYPNKDNFLVSLYKEPIGEVADSDDYDQEISTRTYRGMLLQKESSIVEGGDEAGVDEETLNTAGVDRYHIQLVDLAAEQLRMKTVGGIYRDMRTDDVVRGVLSWLSSDLGLDEEASVKGVDVVSGNNDRVRDHVIVPQGVRAMAFPDYIQEFAGGIYSAGLGYYLQNGVWFVYPQYNLKRFTNEPKNLTVFNIPRRRLPGIERTFLTDADRVTILSTGQTTQTDESEVQQLSLGNGTRYLDANRTIDLWREVNQNVATVSRQENMRELTLRSRKVGLNYAPMSPRRITANPYFEASQIAPRMGTVIQTVWENADPDLIYPGMPVRYVYMEQEVLNDIYGIVLGADYATELQGRSITSTRYRCNVVLTLFVDIASAPTPAE